jgi:hypothetical protein
VGLVPVEFRDDGEFKDMVIKEFVLAGAWEKDGKVKEGEAVKGEVAKVEIVNGPGAVVVAVENSVYDEEERSQGQDTECLSGDALLGALTWSS